MLSTHSLTGFRSLLGLTGGTDGNTETGFINFGTVGTAP